jgi:uncharacterized protein YeaO (DUF488 family)
MHEFENDLVPPPLTRIRSKRVYAAAEHDDGLRVLVDRLWPRGVSKRQVALAEWLPDVAPTPALRKWFAHDPRRFREFKRRYRAELRANTAAVAPLAAFAKRRRLTLLYAAKSERFNHAVVLAEFLRQGAARAARRSSTTR